MIWPAVPLKKTVFNPGLKVPPLFVQLPLILIVVPAVNIPVVKVRVAVAVLLIFKVAGQLKFPVVMVKLLDVSVTVLPPVVRSWPGVRLTTILKKVCATAVPVISCAAVPTKLTVFSPGVKTPPLLVQLPVIFTLAPAVKVPAFRVSAALAVLFIFRVAGAVKFPVVKVRLLVVRETVLAATVNVCPAVFSSTILKNVWVTAVPLMACAPVPVKLTVLAPGIKLPPLLVQLPVMLMIAPALNMPPVRVSTDAAAVLLMFSVAGAVKFPDVMFRLLVVNATVLPPQLNI